jgi:hypothetical protein
MVLTRLFGLALVLAAGSYLWFVAIPDFRDGFKHGVQAAAPRQ